MQQIQTLQLKQLNKGEFFRRVINGKIAKKTYIKEDYNRSSKKYQCTNYNDINDYVELKANTIVTTEFIF